MADDDTAEREFELEMEAWKQVEEAGHSDKAVGAYRSNVGESYTPLFKTGDDGEIEWCWEDWIGDFEEAYQGEMSPKDFAYDLADSLGFLKEMEAINLAQYFDYEAWERDLFCVDYYEIDGFIFRSL